MRGQQKNERKKEKALLVISRFIINQLHKKQMSDKEGVRTQSNRVTTHDNILSTSCEVLGEDKEVSADFNLKKPTTDVASNCVDLNGDIGAVDHVQLAMSEVIPPPPNPSATTTINALPTVDFIASLDSDESDIIVINDEELSQVDRQIGCNDFELSVCEDPVASNTADKHDSVKMDLEHTELDVET